MTPEEEAHNALVAAHPKALRVCRALRQVIVCAAAALIIAVLVLCFILSLSPQLRPHELWFWLAVKPPLYVGVVSCALLAVLLPIWLAIVTFFFGRYSLGQLLGAILIGGACGTAIVSLSGPVLVLPITALCGLVLWVTVFIGRQDPDQPAYTPGFLKKAMAARNKPKGTGE